MEQEHAQTWARKIHKRRQPCVICGEPGERHHEDYDRPLDIMWLCHAHHMEWHARKRQLSASWAKSNPEPLTNDHYCGREETHEGKTIWATYHLNDDFIFSRTESPIVKSVRSLPC